ncbi:MAG: hypothetical protein EXR75_06130 [Myxococcales bacterium]|nr:hypothetical protein [Myxococcales bacterium]
MRVRASQRLSLTGAMALLAATGSSPAGAAGPALDAAQVLRAAEHFDEGGRASRAGKFELAGSQFEAAFEALPNARTLRNAIRARDKAGQLARAATLAALAKSLYPDDAETRSLADELVVRAGPSHQRIDVRCASACVLAVDSYVVVGGHATERRLYVGAGRVVVSASFTGGGSVSEQLVAVAGGETRLSFERPLAFERPIGAGANTVDAARVSESAHGSLRVAARAEPLSNSSVAGSPPESPEPGAALGARSWLRAPGVFYGALALTGALGGATIWSGIDTVSEPGREVVREACAGRGTDCPEYQLGKSKELRTNLLIGGTAASGALSVLIAALVTDWRAESSEPAELTVTLAPGGASLHGRF